MAARRAVRPDRSLPSPGVTLKEPTNPRTTMASRANPPAIAIMFCRVMAVLPLAAGRAAHPRRSTRWANPIAARHRCLFPRIQDRHANPAATVREWQNDMNSALDRAHAQALRHALLRPSRRDRLEPAPSATRGSATSLSMPPAARRLRATDARSRRRSGTGRQRSTTWRALSPGPARPWRSCAGRWRLPPPGYRTDDRLSEIHYGHWEGELWTELPAKDPEGFAAREADRWGWQPRGGESYRALSERVARWLGEIDRDVRGRRARRRHARAARPAAGARARRDLPARRAAGQGAGASKPAAPLALTRPWRTVAVQRARLLPRAYSTFLDFFALLGVLAGHALAWAGVPDLLADLAAHLALLGRGRMGEGYGRQCGQPEHDDH